MTQDGRHALIVDGAPFLILGAQSHNSSAWPAMLPKVWPAIDSLHANTLEIPIYWEQFEPEPGRYDTSILNTIIEQAREHDVRLVLLWFGTWKNGSSHYLPLWLKNQPEKCPRIIGKDGRRVDSPSPHSAAALEADRHAFSAFMRLLKSIDTLNTVIMIQVENEPGSWNTVRDFSPEAQKTLHCGGAGRVVEGHGDQTRPRAAPGLIVRRQRRRIFPRLVRRAFHRPGRGGRQGGISPADVRQRRVARSLTPGPASTYESGGATDNVLWIWKAAAPSIDLLAPDIYQPDSARYLKVLELYGRPDNALFVPETGGTSGQARMCFAALGHGAIGWSPFGLDYTKYASQPLGASRMTEESLAPVALNYRILGPIMRGRVCPAQFRGQTSGGRRRTG